MEDGSAQGDSPRDAEPQEKTEKPPFCVPGVYPSQCSCKFSNIRFFSDFDSGNLLKVR